MYVNEGGRYFYPSIQNEGMVFVSGNSSKPQLIMNNGIGQPSNNQGQKTIVNNGPERVTIEINENVNPLCGVRQNELLTIDPSAINTIPEISHTITVEQPLYARNDSVVQFIESVEPFQSSVEDRKSKKSKKHPASVVHNCTVCNYTSSKKHVLNRHMKTHNQDKPFKCDECGRGFKSSKILQNHVKSHHLNKTHKCKFCSLAFTTSRGVILHVRHKHKNEGGAEDKKLFALSTARKSIVKTYTRKNQFKCKLCPRSFTTLGGFLRHQRYSHLFTQGKNKKVYASIPQKGSKTTTKETNEDGNLICQGRKKDSVTMNPSATIDLSDLSPFITLQQPSNSKNGSVGKSNKADDQGRKRNVNSGATAKETDEGGNLIICEERKNDSLTINQRAVLDMPELSHFMNVEPSSNSKDGYIDESIEENDLEERNNVNKSTDQIGSETTTKDTDEDDNLIGEELRSINNVEKPLNSKDGSVVESNEADDRRSAQNTKLAGSISKKEQLAPVHICSYCNYSSSKKHYLICHMKTHIKERPYVCNVCERGFKTVRTLQNHVNTHTGIKPYKCNFCSSTFASSGELQRHVKYKHTHLRPHKCNMCDYEAVELSRLKRHMISHREQIYSETGELPPKPSYKCSHCSYTCYTNSRLKRHILVHTGEKPFHCKVCEGKFTQSNHLKTHMLIHTGKKPVFACEQCPSSCGAYSALKKHVEQLHTPDPSKPLKCTKCDESFSDRYTYKKHVRTHDGEKCFKCDQCSFSTSKSMYLKSHMIIHTEETPFHCSKCQMSFKHKQSLTRHNNVSHSTSRPRRIREQIPVECEVCYKTFTHKGYLIRHMVTHESSRASSENEMSEENTTNTTKRLSRYRKSKYRKSKYRKSQNVIVSNKGKKEKVNTSTHEIGSEIKTEESVEDTNSIVIKKKENDLQTKDTSEANDISEINNAKDVSVVEFNESNDSVEETSEHDETERMTIEIDGGDLKLMCEERKNSLLSSDPNTTNENFVSENMEAVDPIRVEDRNMNKCLISKEEPISFVHMCTYCDFSSSEKNLLSRHMKSHVADKPYVCDICNRGFKTLATLQNHINTHTGNKPYKCKLCSSTFKTSGEVSRHVKYKHTHEKPHKCNQCDYATVDSTKLKRHLLFHTGERPHKCTTCSYATHDIHLLRCHVKTHTKEKPFECDICAARFTHSNSRKVHMLIHSGEIPEFHCNLCPVSLKRKKALNAHIKKMHTNDPGEPMKKCPKCDESFPDRYTMKEHLKRHVGEKRFQCDDCSYATTKFQHLKSHKRTHTGEKPFKCSECEVCFRHKNSLKNHHELCHNPSRRMQYAKKRPIVCEICHQKFRHTGFLSRHMACHHGEKSGETTTNQTKPLSENDDKSPNILESDNVDNEQICITPDISIATENRDSNLLDDLEVTQLPENTNDSTISENKKENYTKSDLPAEVIENELPESTVKTPTGQASDNTNDIKLESKDREEIYIEV